MDGQRAQCGPAQRQEETTRALAERERAGAGEMPGCAAGAESALKLIRPQRVLWVNTEVQQDWQRDEPAAARDGIHKTGDQSGSKQKREFPRAQHRLDATLCPSRVQLDAVEPLAHVGVGIHSHGSVPDERDVAI